MVYAIKVCWQLASRIRTDKFIFGIKLYMFRTVPLPIIRSFSLYIQQWYMSYRFADSLRAGSGRMPWSCSQAVSKPVWHIPLLCVQWKTPDDGQRNCPKHVEFYFKNKFEKLVHLVGFIIRIYHDSRSPERQISAEFVTRANCEYIICTAPGTNIKLVIDRGEPWFRSRYSD